MNILLFGILSDYIVKDDVPWESFNTINDIETFLKSRYPILKDIPIQFAVNHQMVSSDFILNEVNELALMSPFSGG